MTFENKMAKFLESHGLWSDDVPKVMKLAKEHKSLEAMQDVWQRGIEAYPPAMVTVAWTSVKAVAKDWIATNAPEAWYRPMFD